MQPSTHDEVADIRREVGHAEHDRPQGQKEERCAERKGERRRDGREPINENAKLTIAKKARRTRAHRREHTAAKSVEPGHG
jgi:hypothetical protein